MIDFIINKGVNTIRKAYGKFHSSYYNTEELPKIVFVHVPKCAGTSINRAFIKIYRNSCYNVDLASVYEGSNQYLDTQDELDTDQYTEEYLSQVGSGIILFTYALQNRKYLTGHISYNEKMINFLKEMDYNFVTLLRNPVDRTFSHYLYNYYKLSGFQRTDENFEEFLQNRPELGYFYLSYFGRVQTLDDCSLDHAIEVALKKFKVIGRLDKIDRFYKKIESNFDITLQRLKKNKNPAPKSGYHEFKNSKKNREMVKEICRPDLKLIERMKAENLY
jgi:hypothetical protein